MSKLCYEIMRHVSGDPEYMDKCITSGECLTKEDAVKITTELNYVLRSEPVKYYWRMRDEHIS